MDLSWCLMYLVRRRCLWCYSEFYIRTITPSKLKNKPAWTRRESNLWPVECQPKVRHFLGQNHWGKTHWQNVMNLIDRGEHRAQTTTSSPTSAIIFATVKGIGSAATQQCNVVLYVYAVYWLRPGLITDNGRGRCSRTSAISPLHLEYYSNHSYLNFKSFEFLERHEIIYRNPFRRWWGYRICQGNKKIQNIKTCKQLN